jgi:hypothetical protein
VWSPQGEDDGVYRTGRFEKGSVSKSEEIASSVRHSAAATKSSPGLRDQLEEKLMIFVKEPNITQQHGGDEAEGCPRFN